MNLESQLCKFDDSQQLELLKSNQVSLYYWTITKSINDKEISTVKYSAYTSHELLELLPATFIGYPFEMNKNTGPNYISTYTVGYPALQVSKSDENLNVALSKLLIYVIENLDLNGPNSKS